jgi:hypothetical protein
MFDLSAFIQAFMDGIQAFLAGIVAILNGIFGA